MSADRNRWENTFKALDEQDTAWVRVDKELDGTILALKIMSAGLALFLIGLVLGLVLKWGG